MTFTRKQQWLAAAAATVAVVAGGWWYWQHQQAGRDPEGFASGNGRIEATEVDIAAKGAGRVQDILVNEGDPVKVGQVVAHMDNTSMQAVLHQAEAQLLDAQSKKVSALALVSKTRADIVTAEAVLRQREGERGMARTTLGRTQSLLADRAISQQQVDEDRTRVNSTESAVSVARAQIQAVKEGLQVAQAQVRQAQAGIDAAQAGVARIRSELDDTDLKAPRSGRIQYRVVQPGEVVGAGGRVLSMLDLHDVYMTFFLPDEVAGQVGLGNEVRIVLDAAPGFVIPATVSYVAGVAQFTPKAVETRNERQKLMFRVKARVDPALLQKYQNQVKSGMTGVAHVRLDARHDWPQNLQVHLP